MSTKFDLKDNIDIAWCPGCGNFGILPAVKIALDELNVDRKDVVLVSGIGQAAKTPQYIKVHYFNGLHGRALPVATAIKASNPELTVIAESGDGDMYGEGGNHFLHAIRRNTNITNIVHNNMVYGLTKGQASPTSQKGFKTPLQTEGVYLKPVNPIALAIIQGATFVARAYSNDKGELQKILKQAIKHKGYSLVDIFQPCVSFNKLNTPKWFKDNTYYLDDEYDPKNRMKALEISLKEDKLALGIIYREKDKKTFEDNLLAHRKYKEPLYKRKVNFKKIQKAFESK